jgi:hypothetical protein
VVRGLFLTQSAAEMIPQPNAAWAEPVKTGIAHATATTTRAALQVTFLQIVMAKSHGCSPPGICPPISQWQSRGLWQMTGALSMPLKLVPIFDRQIERLRISSRLA